MHQMTVHSKFDTFPWPNPMGRFETPVWRGAGFLVGVERRRILEFGDAESHWSPELTALHEQEAGVNHPIDQASRSLAVESLEQFLDVQEPVILDVGSSSGYILREIQRAFPRAALIGSDYLVEPLLTLANNMPELPILQFDLRHCPLPDQCVDAVTALNVLEHIDQHEKALGQIYRILRPGGIAHIEVPAGPDLFDVYDELLLHHRRYKLEELVTMVRRAGFEVLKRTHLGFLIFGPFWFVKKRNQRLLSLPKSQKKQIVTLQIRNSTRSRILASCLTIERFFGRRISYPWGIRCVVVGLKKNA